METLSTVFYCVVYVHEFLRFYVNAFILSRLQETKWSSFLKATNDVIIWEFSFIIDCKFWVGERKFSNQTLEEALTMSSQFSCG